MTSHNDSTPPSGAGPGYEVRDTNIKYVLGFGVGLLVMIGLVQIVLWGMLRGISGGKAELPSTLETPDVIHHQRVALTDREKAMLEGGYGWTDKTAGTVRIPIEDAMNIVATRGIPVASDRPRTSIDVNSHAGAPEKKDGKETKP